MCQYGANGNQWTGYRMGQPRPPLPPNPPNRGVEKSPFEIAAKRLEIYHVNTELIGIHGRATEGAHPDPHVRKQRDRKSATQIEHIMWGNRAA